MLKRALLILSLLATLGAAAASAAGSGVETMLVRLDSCIRNKGHYDQEKEHTIGQIRARLSASQTDADRYATYYRLYTEYMSYRYDSAYVYANLAMKQATKLQNRNFQVEAGCALVFCHVSAGLFKEAFDIMESIRNDGADEDHQKQYYNMWVRLYYDIANYNRSQAYEQEYVEKGNLYTDSLLRHVPENTMYWHYVMAQRLMKSHEFQKSAELFARVIASDEADAHLQAIAYSCIGWIRWMEGKEDEAIVNLAESAIRDVQKSTKENMATCGLANILYSRGDTKRAIEYARSSLADANFYGARHRKIEVGEILPIIEQDRYQLMKRQRNLSIGMMVIAVLFVVGLLTATVVIRRQVRKLREAQRIINEHNQALEQTNQSLREANKIKTEYIGKSFYINAEYIQKVEKLYQAVDRKIIAKQYDDLHRSLKETMIKAERVKMYEVFDETFLKLFPNFVERFNCLFEEKDRRLPEDDKSLTSEMRIFALIRLGVTDSERIANFLDYSVHTINTYKTRVKNKSIVDNDAFEQHIMSI